MKPLVGMVKSAIEFLLRDTLLVRTLRLIQASKGTASADGAHPKYAARKADDEQDQCCPDSQHNLRAVVSSSG